MWDINTKPHSSKKLGVDPFLVQKWTKNCKKTADFQVAKKICLTVNFLFYCKNQLFQTLSIAWFFKSQAFCHWGVRQPKIFSMCLLYDYLGPYINSIQFFGVILASSLPFLQFFSYTKGFYIGNILFLVWKLLYALCNVLVFMIMSSSKKTNNYFVKSWK